MRNGWNWKYPLSYMYPAHTQLVAKCSSPSIGDQRATGCADHKSEFSKMAKVDQIQPNAKKNYDFNQCGYSSRSFPKIHPFWYRHPSLTIMMRSETSLSAIVGIQVLLQGGHVAQTLPVVFVVLRCWEFQFRGSFWSSLWPKLAKPLWPMPMYWTFNCFLGCIYSIYSILSSKLTFKSWISTSEKRGPSCPNWGHGGGV